MYGEGGLVIEDTQHGLQMKEKTPFRDAKQLWRIHGDEIINQETSIPLHINGVNTWRINKGLLQYERTTYHYHMDDYDIDISHKLEDYEDVPYHLEDTKPEKTTHWLLPKTCDQDGVAVVKLTMQPKPTNYPANMKNWILCDVDDPYSRRELSQNYFAILNIKTNCVIDFTSEGLQLVARADHFEESQLWQIDGDQIMNKQLPL